MSQNGKNVHVLDSGLVAYAWKLKSFLEPFFKMEISQLCSRHEIFVLLAFVDGTSTDVAGLLERASRNIKMKLYNEALNDLNSAIEADPTLSEAYLHRASTHRMLCRCAFIIGLYFQFGCRS